MTNRNLFRHAIELLSEYAEWKALDLNSLCNSTNEARSLVLADQFSRLHPLLNEKSLAQEVTYLQREYKVHMKKSNNGTTIPFTSLAKDLSKAFGESNHLAALITFMPDNLDEQVTADILRFEIMQWAMPSLSIT